MDGLESNLGILDPMKYFFQAFATNKEPKPNDELKGTIENLHLPVRIFSVSRGKCFI